VIEKEREDDVRPKLSFSKLQHKQMTQKAWNKDPTRGKLSTLKLLEKALDPGLGTKKSKQLRSKEGLTSNQISASNCTTWKSRDPEQKPQTETLSTFSPTLKTHNRNQIIQSESYS
jgi:hypothetical protein